MESKRNFDVVIWDWDGTLKDNIWVYELAVKKIFSHFAVSYPGTEIFKATVNDHFIEFLHNNGIPETIREADINVFIKEVYASLTEPIKIFPDAKTSLEIIKSAGIRQILVSGKSPKYLMSEVKQDGLEGYFELIVGDAGGKKSEVFQDCLARINCLGARVAAIGDVASDAIAAFNIGATAFICPRGFQTCGRVEELLRDYPRPIYVDNLGHFLLFLF